MAIRWALIKKKAGHLLEEAEVASAPIHVEACAELLNATIRFQPLEGSVSGMVHKTADGTAIIGINSLHSETRQRFSIAHEIGHLSLHGGEDLHIDEERPSLIAFRDRNSSLGVDDKEIEANQFAAELLMPEPLILKDYEKISSKLKDGEDIIEALSQLYKVSVQSMTIRLSKLGLFRA